ncbi:MAG: Rdx family protein [Armatimonadetes bacterium]|nr:Rdx family protein [Armatimonadota bacterium]
MASEVIETYKSPVGLAHPFTEVTLVPGSGGVFDVSLDGVLVFSKKAMGRHAEPGEILRLIQERTR